MGSWKGQLAPGGQTNGLKPISRVPIWLRGEWCGRMAPARARVIGAPAWFVTMTASAKVAPGSKRRIVGTPNCTSVLPCVWPAPTSGDLTRAAPIGRVATYDEPDDDPDARIPPAAP